MAPRRAQTLLLISWLKGVDVLFSPGPGFGRHQLPSHGVRVPTSGLSDLTCLRNRRKNSANPRPDIPQTSFTSRARLKDPEDSEEGGSDENEAELDDDDIPSSRLTQTIDDEDDAPKPPLSRSLTSAGVWSNRSQAAKRRWADPEYREKVVKKRRENAAAAAAAAPARTPSSGLAIGPLDSVVFSPSRAQTEIWRSKADEINRWARANQLRREGTLRWKRDPMGWTLANLEAGKDVRARMNNETYKAFRQHQRKLKALTQWETRRRNEAEAEAAASERLAARIAAAAADRARALDDNAGLGGSNS